MGAVAAKLERAKTAKDRKVEDMLHSKQQLKKLWKDLDFNGMFQDMRTADSPPIAWGLELALRDDAE